MDQVFLYSKHKKFSYHDFDAASAVLRKALPHSSNRKIMVLSAQPELYYLAFYCCFNYDYIYCPVTMQDDIAAIEAQIAIINPGAIITNSNLFLTHCRQQEHVYEPLQLPAFDTCYLCFRETESPDGYSSAGLRYITFTAGRSGAAMGVGISNANISAFSDNLERLFEVEETAVIANAFAFSSDLSILAMYLAWNNHASIAHITEDEIRNDAFYPDWPAFRILCIVPSVLRLMQKNRLFRRVPLQSLRHILFCSEPLFETDMQLIKEHCANAAIINCFGIPELSIFCTTYEAAEVYHSFNRIVSIGKLNTGCRAYIADAQLTAGGNIEGELCVAGEQIFSGYLNMPDSHHFTELNGERYFKTGHLVIYNKEEDLYYYVGRVEREIRYQGHRINLNKLEYLFSGMHPITDAAAIYSRKYMTIGLFFTSSPGFKLEDHMHLLENIPAHLRPTHFFPTPHFPMNAHFKKDYPALEQFYQRYLDKMYE